jgi:hypothetical protein
MNDNHHRNGGSGAQPLYVITLMSSTSPMPLVAPTAPGFAGLAVFRSRRREDNRDRFRLNIGYFTSIESAEALLPLARESYPAAFVAPAPESNLGSLEDTAVARFSVIKPVPAPVETARPVRAAEPAPVPIEPPRPVAAPPSRPAEPAAAEQEPKAQRYAVQLVWSGQPIDLVRLPQLPIFDGYLLYVVESERGARRMYGVRLGFYVDVPSAQLVAHYVRTHFRGATAVPVSDRECGRAAAAAVRPATLRAVRSAGKHLRWPQSAIAVEFAATVPT